MTTPPIKPGTARRLGLRLPRWTAGARITAPMVKVVERHDGSVLTAAVARRQQRRS